MVDHQSGAHTTHRESRIPLPACRPDQSAPRRDPGRYASPRILQLDPQSRTKLQATSGMTWAAGTDPSSGKSNSATGCDSVLRVYGSIRHAGSAIQPPIQPRASRLHRRRPTPADGLIRNTAPLPARTNPLLARNQSRTGDCKKIGSGTETVVAVDGYASSIRCRSSGNPARPYICRFRSLTLVLAPSIGPLL
jgi:hypothetical protein